MYPPHEGTVIYDGISKLDALTTNMWLHHSVVVWLYAVSLIPSIVHFNFSPFLFFFLHLYLLHSLTKSYLFRRHQLSAIRCRLLTGCILSPPIQKYLLWIFFATPISIITFTYFAVTSRDDDLDGNLARVEEFKAWVNATIQGVQSAYTSEINPTVIAIRTVAVSIDSARETLVAWLLTKGYQSMVETTVFQTQVTVRTITVTDIFTFALVGMLGTRIGYSMTSSIFSMIVSMTSRVPTYEEWWIQLFITPAIQLIRLAQALISVAIFSISACDSVLGVHTNIAALVAAVFGINIAINVEGLLWFDKVNRVVLFDEVNRVLGFVAWIVSAGVLFYAGREVWKRFRVLKATEFRLRPRIHLWEGVKLQHGIVSS